jgi:hypothetical protein
MHHSIGAVQIAFRSPQPMPLGCGGLPHPPRASAILPSAKEQTTSRLATGRDNIEAKKDESHEKRTHAKGQRSQAPD